MIEFIFLPGKLGYAWSTKGFMPWRIVYRNNRCNALHSSETKSVNSDQLSDVTNTEDLKRGGWKIGDGAGVTMGEGGYRSVCDVEVCEAGDISTN